ncbi:MAG: hypothetical protein ACJ8M1_02665 [Chthoniobacterales bacterium]
MTAEYVRRKEDAKFEEALAEIGLLGLFVQYFYDAINGIQKSVLTKAIILIVLNPVLGHLASAQPAKIINLRV